MKTKKVFKRYTIELLQSGNNFSFALKDSNGLLNAGKYPDLDLVLDEIKKGILNI